MAKECYITGKRTVTGNHRSHAMNANKRTWEANLQTVKIKDANGVIKKVKVSARGLKTLKKHGKLIEGTSVYEYDRVEDKVIDTPKKKRKVANPAPEYRADNVKTKKAAPKKAAPKKEAPVKEEPAKEVEVAEATATETEAPAAAEAKDYSKMTVAELKEAAKEQGISGISGMKKADLLEALTK